eukprot:3925564-Rhodomonas_salina.2
MRFLALDFGVYLRGVHTTTFSMPKTDPARGAPRRSAPRTRPMQTPTSVSYTHLTLPTICSV